MLYRYVGKGKPLKPIRTTKLEDMRMERDRLLIKKYWRLIKLGSEG